MTWRTLLLASALLTVPLAATGALGTTDSDAGTGDHWHDGDDAYYNGTAEQDSRHEPADWHDTGHVCLDVVTYFHFTFEVVSGDANDTVTLTAGDLTEDGNETLDLRPGERDSFVARQGDTCGDFAVVGTSVNDTADYRLRVTTLPGPADHEHENGTSSFTGVVGTEDLERSDWHDEPHACATVLTDFEITFTVVSGSSATIEAYSYEKRGTETVTVTRNATLEPGESRTLLVQQGNACGSFTVSDGELTGEAEFRVEMREASVGPVDHWHDDEDTGLTHFTGVAAQDTEHETGDWHEDAHACAAVLTDFRITLRVNTGASNTTLTLSAPTHDLLEVSVDVDVGEERSIDVTQSDSCPEFTVTGTEVPSTANYEVFVEEI